MLRKVVLEFDAPSIKHYDGDHCVVHGDQANENWWNANKCNVDWGGINGYNAPDIFSNIISMALYNVSYPRDQQNFAFLMKMYHA